MNNKIALESLSMDLLRIAIGMNRGSIKMAETFQKEAIIRQSEIKLDLLKPYMQNIILSLSSLFENKNSNQKAEYALMYSTQIRNYCSHYLTPD